MKKPFIKTKSFPTAFQKLDKLCRLFRRGQKQHCLDGSRFSIFQTEVYELQVRPLYFIELVLVE
jgi:hypothetical protein